MSSPSWRAAIRVIPERRGRPHDAVRGGGDEDGERLVGTVREAPGGDEPENTVFSDQAVHGTPFGEAEVDKLRRAAGFRDRRDNGDAGYTWADKRVSPAEISAMVLQKLKRTPRITWEPSRRRSSRCRRTSTTPSARPPRTRADRRPRGAAHHQRADGGGAGVRAGQEEGREVIAVYDLGGGTFDISILAWATASSR
jgi:molecular chaperone DnaK